MSTVSEVKPQSPYYSAAPFVSKYAGKLATASLVAFFTPPFGAVAALAVAVVTRGRVRNPLMWFLKPDFEGRMGPFMGVAATTAVASVFTQEFADRYTRKV
ncbi:MAG TPA: hypothetical protein VMR37_04975 [Rhabdochlamydiaceae bacterium]|jgi:hypothetical protein|nr:hypothetical protein [Rhabdochlamydiaceae bacterium]